MLCTPKSYAHASQIKETAHKNVYNVSPKSTYAHQKKLRNNSLDGYSYNLTTRIISIIFSVLVMNLSCNNVRRAGG